MKRAYAQLALSMALVGANVPVGKLLAEALPVSLVLLLRCALAVAVLAPLAVALEPRALPGRAVLRNLALQALFGTALYNLALLSGLRLTSALMGGIVLATLPAVTAIGAALVLRERLSRPAWAAVALAALGLGAVNAAGAAEGGNASLLGNALVFAGVLGEAAYVLLAKQVSGRVGVLTQALWMQVFSAALVAPFALPAWPRWEAIGAVGGLLVFHSLTSSVLCLLLWFNGLRRAPAGIAGVFTIFLPATAVALGALWLDEPFGTTHAMGFALMAGSLLLATWPKRS